MCNLFHFIFNTFFFIFVIKYIFQIKIIFNVKYIFFCFNYIWQTLHVFHGKNIQQHPTLESKRTF